MRPRRWSRAGGPLVSVAALFVACGGETIDLPSCVSAPAPAVESSLDDVLRDEVRENAFAVSCGVDGARFGSAGQTCAGSASSCAEWLSCVSGGHCPDFCADHRGTTCDGERVVDCDYAASATSYGRVVEDCATEGMHCAAGACTTGEPCSGGTQTHCDGNAQEACVGGSLWRVACASGTTCVDGTLAGLTFAGCIASDLVCSPPSAPTCDGNTMRACAFGASVSIDCTAPPYSGFCIADPTPTCEAPQGPCADGDPDRCDGTSLEHCVLNQWRPVDCTTIGFATCTSGASGAACVQ